jgi:predicted nucleotidyltransferase
MAETKIYIPDSLDAQLRETAMKRFGYGRGSISRAVETAIVQWLAQEDAIRGALDSIVSEAKKDSNVVSVLLFGGYARKEPSYGDVDVALVLKKTKGSDLLKYEDAVVAKESSRRTRLDIVAFDALPIDLQKRVLNEGVVLYATDERELREVAACVAERWDDFAPTLGYLTK